MQMDPYETFLHRELSLDRISQALRSVTVHPRAVRAGVGGSSMTSAASRFLVQPKSAATGPWLGGWSCPPSAVEKGGPPLASSFTAAHGHT